MGDDDLRWKRLAMGPPTDYAIFDAHVCQSVHPATGKTKSFTVIDSPNWVNVIALTPRDEVVMVRQFRHGIDDLTLEIPGGIVDPGEDALTAAQRELYEETGYRAERWVKLGEVESNPAFMNNHCGIFLALDANLAGDGDLDETEFIEVQLHPLESIPEQMAEGAIRHSLVVSGFFFFLAFTGGWHRPLSTGA